MKIVTNLGKLLADDRFENLILAAFLGRNDFNVDSQRRVIDVDGKLRILQKESVLEGDIVCEPFARMKVDHDAAIGRAQRVIFLSHAEVCQTKHEAERCQNFPRKTSHRVESSFCVESKAGSARDCVRIVNDYMPYALLFIWRKPSRTRSIEDNEVAVPLVAGLSPRF